MANYQLKNIKEKVESSISNLKSGCTKDDFSEALIRGYELIKYDSGKLNF